MLRRAFLVAATAVAVVGCLDQVSPNPLAPSQVSSSLVFAPVVNSLADDGDGICSNSKCTLRDAITAAQVFSTITFSVTGTITLNPSRGPLRITRPFTVEGPGADNLAVDGGGSVSLLTIDAGIVVGISGLTFQHGDASVMLTAGAIVNNGTTTITNCVITDNQFTEFESGAGGIWNAIGATLTLLHTTVSDNSGHLRGGGIINEGTLTLDRSTITNNIASQAGGGIVNDAGAILVITNSTLTGNASPNGAGVLNGGTATVTSTTIASNVGSGVYNFGIATLKGTIVANNGGINCSGAVTDGGYNLEGGLPFSGFTPNTCAFGAVGSQSVMDAKLGALADNGGPTKTMALVSGSPAKDKVPLTINGCGTSITTDQRGVARPQRGGCDVGAFEVENQLPVASVGGTYSGNEGSPVTLSMSGSDADGDALKYKWDLGDGTSSDGITPPPSSHVYKHGGTYTISLIIGDGFAVSDEKTTTVTIANVAPSVLTFSGPADPQAVGAPVSASGTFTDAGALGTHTALINWGDGSSSAASVTESNGSGSFNGSHAYATPGVYTLTGTITDDDGASANKTFQYVVVYDPTGGFVTGGGWINSPLGAYVANATLTGKAMFGFVSRYQKGATTPSGMTRFEFSVANLVFQGTSYQWLTVAGPQAQFKGEGTINGAGQYGFMITAGDGHANGGGGTDTFRIKIWDLASGNVIYDNGPNTPLGGGNINIHP